MTTINPAIRREHLTKEEENLTRLYDEIMTDERFEKFNSLFYKYVNDQTSLSQEEKEFLLQCCIMFIGKTHVDLAGLVKLSQELVEKRNEIHGKTHH